MRTAVALLLAALPVAAQYSSFSIQPYVPLLETTQGQPLAYTVPVTGGVAPYSFSISGDPAAVPAGFALQAATGIFTTTAAAAGSTRLEFCVRDATRAVVCAPYSIRIGALGAPAPTVLPAGRVNNYYSQPLVGAYSNQFEYTLVSGALPPGITLNTFGRLVGAPLAPPGGYSFTLRKRDTIEGGSELQDYVLSVEGPLLASAALPNGFLGTEYRAPMTVFGGTPPYKWSLLRGPLPAGFGFSEDGVISGLTTVTAGPFPFTARVQDAAGGSYDREITLTIEPALAPLTLSTATLPAATLGAAYRIALGAAGGREPYSWRVASGALPPGLTMTAAGVIAGTPGAAGSFVIQVELRDVAGNSRVTSYTLTVLGGLTVTSAATLPAATGGVGYRTALTAAGGVAPYRWALTAGSLPPGLALSAEGALAGVPEAGGRFAFTVTVTDAAGAAASQAATLTVTPGKPVISQGGIVNAASFAGTAAAPGEIVTVFGSQFGVRELIVFTLDAAGRVPTALGGVRLLFDGVAAPLLYVAPGQLSAIVPYAAAGRSASAVTLAVGDLVSEPVRLPIAGTAPAIFTADASGRGEAAAVFTGDVVTFYATGEGVTDPAAPDGSVAAEPLPKPVAAVKVRIGGQEAEVLYAGSAPGLVLGLLQVNARVPAGVAGTVPVTLQVGNAESVSGVTLRLPEKP